ncbi:MAG TPA: penicillin-binding protein 2 [Terriglobia bacterium]|nr:penicillin-binding protein 2 [Terriglobia bacterium]
MRREELTRLRSRVNFAVYVVAAALLFLVGGFWHFQIAQTGRFIELADKNRFKQIQIPAQRGRILDREGRVLVDNRPSYNVVYVREGARHSLEELANLLGPGLGLTLEDLKDRVDKNKAEPKFRAIILKEDVDVGDIAFVNARKLELGDEVFVQYLPRRKYPEGELAAHAIGYIGEVTPGELKKADINLYKSGDQVGKFGLERRYDSILRGKDGYKRVIVDNRQREIEQFGFENPIKGNDLRTTLDLDLQRAAEAALGDQVGAAVALNPTTGEVLVMASKPGFDPNLFATKISASAYAELNSDPRKRFRNRVIQDHYAPGSVFKIFMAAAGLEAGVLSQQDHVNCTGEVTIDGVTKACWKKGGHGTVGLYEAIVNSCNVFFYTVGKKLDINRIATYAKDMGLGRKTEIDLFDENPGLIPTPEWKARTYRTRSKSDQVWYGAETLDVSIGQGAVSLTILQAAWAMGGLASGGRLVQPHLVNPETLKDLDFLSAPLNSSQYKIRASTVDIVSRGMWGVVNENGTGTRAAVDGFDVAGKTGTAQVVGKKFYGKADDSEDHAWFVGFAPYRNPEIVVAAFIEHGGHGGTAAAPVAHAIFDTYYRKKTGQFGAQTPGTIAQVNP